MKLTKDELKTKVSELVEDNDKAIELLESIEDSVDVADTSVQDELQKKLDETQAKLDDLTEKYKQRFLQGDTHDVKEETKEELKEQDVIDIREI